MDGRRLLGFQQILDRWRADGRMADANHASAALAILKGECVQVFSNLDTDPLISQARRQALLEQLLTAIPDKAKDRVEAFCRAHQCKGRKQPTAQTASLGHVKPRKTIEATLSSVRSPTSGFTRKHRSPTLTVDDILRIDLAGQRRMLSGIPLSAFVMWSFYQLRAPDEPYRGVSKRASELVRRLGLGQTDPADELLLWAHRLRPEHTARVPTTFDAAFYEFFRPGGKTKPLTGNDPLREVVHPPISGEQLIQPIENAS